MKNLRIKIIAIVSILLLGVVLLINCNKKETVNPSTDVNYGIQENAQSIGVANLDGHYLIDKENLLESFNNVTPNANALEVEILFDGNVYTLSYLLDNSSVISYVLDENNGELSINGNSTMITHTCSGDPCNACKINLGGWFSQTTCECTQTGCSDCKCNHTVSTGVNLGDVPGPAVLVGELAS